MTAEERKVQHDKDVAAHQAAVAKSPDAEKARNAADHAKYEQEAHARAALERKKNNCRSMARELAGSDTQTTAYKSAYD